MKSLAIKGHQLIRNKLAILISAIAVIACFVLVQQSFAQEPIASPESTEKKFNLSFPIAELGNCSSKEDCKAYCSQEANQEACISFAKKKGFYKEDNSGRGNARDRALLEKAKSELGCASEEACKAFCSDETNRDKCIAFAKKYGINTDSPTSGNREILEKAKQILGCDSPESCKAICENEANRDKCSQFAKSAGLRGGTEKIGPGGCKSEEECKSFCSNPDNFEKCQQFGGGANRQFRGPGGCYSRQSCESFCQENEDKCQGFKEKFENNRELEKKCSENPEECLKQTEQQVIKEFKKDEEFCKQNPEKCKEFAPNSERAFENANERAKFCRENPDKCGRLESNFKINQEKFEKQEFKLKERKEFESPEQKRPREFTRPPEQGNSGQGSFNSGSGSFNSGASQSSGSENSGSGSSDSESGSGESNEPSVQGVTTSSSIFEQIWRIFFK